MERRVPGVESMRDCVPVRAVKALEFRERGPSLPARRELEPHKDRRAPAPVASTRARFPVVEARRLVVAYRDRPGPATMSIPLPRARSVA